ncbi:uncharacterized protein BO80DRAFT_440539 [Aspergillus ibericus CBS 121593]|uniref:Uncharacterized protein n=1 Tax=Aspergillus ibericus CBS 121593 TaxID=1448316 RepID=A0A395HCV5_9EURO|nr:hypothetical protein BO80DRAFT_440539 [Aspergillus ibericus CBS 121593]RAL05791.1 hypothetical protein BO80DRAFT_440539 [Aspergillus ibericus CBS 121593]
MTKSEVLGCQYQTQSISIIPYDEHEQGLVFYGPGQKETEDYEATEASAFIEELEELHESEQSSSILTFDQSFFKETPQDTQHEEFYSLIITSLESLLLGHNESNTQSEKRLQSLPQLFPSAFSPGYYKEMSQRSQLIPSIAKSLSSMIKLPNYQSLLPKVNNLTASATTPPFSINPSNTRNNIKAALWRIAQKQLYKPQASRELRLLAPSPPKLQDRKHQQSWDDGTITGSQVAHTQHHDVNSDQEYAEEDLLGFSESDEVSCEMLSTAFSSSIGSLRFSQSNDDLISELEEDILSPTPFSEDLTFNEEFGDYEDDMLCGYI